MLSVLSWIAIVAGAVWIAVALILFTAAQACEANETYRQGWLYNASRAIVWPLLILQIALGRKDE